ncbi:hypothetical protein ZIOFF_066707 [Zingiber officinale]|uniref:Uncharacterized protein n=1 Tax=Zingiber officinale TaxID=94328 RepID=A0A8J5KI02_ZINOF|nr:hypothetical protein ZIOFF_066707 [Zingiber officinale]
MVNAGENTAFLLHPRESWRSINSSRSATPPSPKQRQKAKDQAGSHGDDLRALRRLRLRRPRPRRLHLLQLLDVHPGPARPREVQRRLSDDVRAGVGEQGRQALQLHPGEWPLPALIIPEELAPSQSHAISPEPESQRGHQNSLEMMPAFVVTLLLSGLYCPVGAAALGVVYTVGRYYYFKGYATGVPDNRLTVGRFAFMALLGLMILTTVVGVRLVLSR